MGENMEVTKADLIDYRELCRKLELLDKSIKKLKKEIFELNNTPRNINKPPKLPFPSKVERLVVLLDFEEETRAKAIEKRITLERFIYSLPSERDQNVMRYRYIEKKSFLWISLEMDKSVQYIKDLHTKITKNL